MNFRPLCYFAVFLFVISTNLKAQDSFAGWIDSVFLYSADRSFDKLTALCESVIAQPEKVTKKDIAFANVFISKMYQIRSRLDLAEEALTISGTIIHNNFSDHDSLQFLQNRYNADQQIYTGNMAAADSMLQLAEKYGSAAFGARSYQMCLYYSSRLVFHQVKGEFYKSLDASQKALEISYEVFDSTATSIAAFENNVGIAYSMLDKVSRSREHLERAMSVMMANNGENDVSIIQLLNNIGSLENTLGNFNEALKYLIRGIDKYNEMGLTEYNDMIIDLLYNAAYSHTKLDDYKRAEDYMSQAARFLNENVQFYQHYSGALDIDMSMHARLGGNFDLAQQKAESALAKYKKAFGEDNSEHIYPLSELAFTAMDQKKYDEAVQYFEEGIAILEQYQMIESENGGDFYSWIGEIEVDRHQYIKGLPYFQNALEIYRAVGGFKNLNVAWCYSSIGGIYTRENNLDLARTYLDSAWMSTIKMGHTYASGSVPALEDINPHIYLRDMILDDCVYNIEKYKKTNDAQFLKNGLNLSKLADRWIDERRSVFQTSDGSSQLISKNYHLYEWALLNAEELYKVTKNDNYVDTAFHFAEKSKSASLYELVSSIALKNEDKIPGHLVTSLNDLEIDIQNYKDLIKDEQMLEKEADQATLKKWNSTLFDLSEEYLKQRNKIRTEYKEYFDLKYNTAVVGLSELQNYLPDNTHLLEYYIGDSAIHFFIIDKHSKTHLVTPVVENLSTQIQALNTAISKRQKAQVEKLSAELFDILFAPVSPYLSVTNLIIIPEGPLHYLNFEMLPNQHDDGQYLIHRYNIQYENSASYYVRRGDVKKSHAKDANWLGVAPGFSDKMKEKYRTSFPKSEWDQEYLNLLKQPNSEILIANLGNKFGKAQSVVGAEANEKYLSAEIGKYTTVHFSTHAEVNNLDPLRSKLVLAKPLDPESGEDGYLTTNEIFNLSLNTDLVVLTACNTGLGKLYRGEGMYSLAKGFQYAGAQNIIMSLWSVDELQSNRLMASFYDELNDGKSIAHSLRQAKLKYLSENNGELQAPFYWAGLVAIGPDSSVNMSPFYTSPTFIIVAVGILLLLAAWFFRRQ